MAENREPTANQLADYASSVKSKEKATTSSGSPLDSITASLTAGPKGPIVLHDFNFIDHLAAFDRERIPERVVHAKGAGIYF
jgi:catalase